jgi:hypothetical protein
MSGSGEHAERGLPGEGGQRRFTPWANQDKNGVDLTLIRANLRLAPLERVRRAEALRWQVLRLHRLAGR